MKKLEKKVAIVTGASKGIGAEIARSLAAEGACVVVNYSSSKEGAELVVSEILNNGGRAVAVKGDVSVAGDVKKIMKAALDNFGGINILVNNSGIYELAPLEAVTEAHFHKHFNINVLGLLLMTQAAVEHLGEGGSIINIGSVVSRITPPGGVVYVGTKGAVEAITGALSRELGARKIRVNAVNPGLVETEGTRTAGMMGGAFEQWALSTTPLGRVGRPKDIAGVVTFLASEDSAWLSGESIIASGGNR